MNDNERLFEETLKVLNNCKGLYDTKDCVVCGMLAGNGKIYTGVNIHWWIATCAESVALGNAFKEMEKDIRLCLSLKFDPKYNVRIVAPCGRCREMFNEFGIETKFITGKKGSKYIVKTLDELLPDRYVK